MSITRKQLKPLTSLYARTRLSDKTVSAPFDRLRLQVGLRTYNLKRESICSLYLLIGIK